jgi:phage shock protein PspC (stress-responsive transcriptional regulator)
VAGGLAEMLDVDPSIIRIVWALAIVLTGGIALLVYIVMAIVVPERPVGVEARQAATPPAGPSPRSAGRSGRSSGARGGLVAGLILILIGGFFLARELIPSIDLGFWWPTVAIGLGVVLIVVALLPSGRSD